MAGSLAPEGAEEKVSLWQRVTALLRGNPMINGVVAVAITVGFFHGWLKIHYPHPAVTFLFDGLLLLALGLVFLNLRPGQHFFPRGPTGRALTAFYAFCLFYLFAPWGPDTLISIAALRGWCFAMLMFCLGYHLTQSSTQVKGYFYILIILSVIVAFYGMGQSGDEIQRMMAEDEVFAQRYFNTYYQSTKGSHVRVFSTFVSSAAFGSTMAFVAIFILVLLLEKTLHKWEKILLVGTLVPVIYGVFLSGARTALLCLLFGSLVIVYFRRNFVNFLLIPLVGLLAFRFALEFTEGGALERYKTLLDFSEIYNRNYWPTIIGWREMMEHPLGQGLGRSGYSVPFTMWSRLEGMERVQADGDLGRLMIEMGVLGVIFFGRVLWVAASQVIKQIRELQGTPIETIALANGACIFMAISVFPSGSPFLSIPTGAMIWFFLGTQQKFYDQMKAGTLETPASPDQGGSVPSQPEEEKRFLYYRPKRQPKPQNNPS